MNVCISSPIVASLLADFPLSILVCPLFYLHHIVILGVNDIFDVPLQRRVLLTRVPSYNTRLQCGCSTTCCFFAIESGRSVSTKHYCFSDLGPNFILFVDAFILYHTSKQHPRDTFLYNYRPCTLKWIDLCGRKFKV